MREKDGEAQVREMIYSHLLEKDVGWGGANEADAGQVWREGV